MRIRVELNDNDDGSGSYWAARHAVAVARKYHETAIAAIDKRGGKTLATTRARRNHDDALDGLRDVMTALVESRKTRIAEVNESNRDRSVHPRFGDQTCCKVCDSDIEYHGSAAGWVTRGGSRFCDTSGAAPRDGDGMPVKLPHTLHKPTPDFF